MKDIRLHQNILSGTSSANVNNSNRDGTKRIGQIVSQYVDPSNNNVLNRVYYSEPVGTPFTYDISNLKSHVPNGFSWGGISSKSANIISYKPDLQTFDVIIRPIPKPQLSQIFIRYVQPKNGGMITSNGDVQHSESGFKGDIFRLSSVKRNVPHGYQLDLDPSDYRSVNFKDFHYIKAPLIANHNPYVRDHDGKMVIKFKSAVQFFEIGVKPIHKTTQMSIIYLDSSNPSNPVEKVTQTKDVGLPFNIKPYEVVPYLSSDYQVVGTPQNVPDKYTLNAKPIIINVARKLAKMMINYVYVDDNGAGHLIKILHVTGKQGEMFNVAKYKGKSYLPPYYQSKDIVNNSTKWVNNRRITIHVIPQDVAMLIIYQLPNGKQIGNTDKIMGAYNTRFDPTKYERLLIDGGETPNNYQVVGHSALPRTYQPNRSITFIVKPLDIMSIIYRDTDYPQKNKRDRGSVPAIPKIDGTPFNVHPYENQLNVPYGYHIVSIGNVPKTYVKGGKAIINIRPNTLTPSNSIKAANTSASVMKSNAVKAGQSSSTSWNDLNKNASSDGSTSLRSSVVNSIMDSLTRRYVMTSASNGPNDVSSGSGSESINVKSNNASDLSSSSLDIANASFSQRSERNDSANEDQINTRDYSSMPSSNTSANITSNNSQESSQAHKRSNHRRDIAMSLITLGHKLSSLAYIYRRHYNDK